MPVVELAVFPQTTWSNTQGLIGVRKWALDKGDDLEDFTRIVANTHWPGQPDAIPIQIQSGAFDEKVVVTRSCTEPRMTGNMGSLPEYGKYLVVATYMLHNMTNCWPTGTEAFPGIPKPCHLAGTTLNIKVRGSGQVLTVAPAGMHYASPLLLCTPGAESLTASMGTRIIVPVTEYHICCDRLTWQQVSTILAFRHWDLLQGCVNERYPGGAKFLGKEDETLLFDGYEIAESMVCHPDSPRRWRMTACLKHRVIQDDSGYAATDGDGRTIGWNHDFVAQGKSWGWRYIKMNRALNTTGSSSGDNFDCRPRYEPTWFFNSMFGCTTTQTCEGSEDEGVEFDETSICGES